MVRVTSCKCYSHAPACLRFQRRTRFSRCTTRAAERRRSGEFAQCYNDKVYSLFLEKDEYIGPRPMARPRGHGELPQCSSCYGFKSG